MRPCINKTLMKKYILYIILSFLTLFAYAEGKVYSVEDVPMVHLHDRTRYVSNPDKILSSASVATIDSMLYLLEENTGIQTVVAVLGDIEGGDCFDFAYSLGQKNGVGQKGRDNGLVVLLSTGERCVQFAVGYGLEGVLPDALCKRIQQKYMVEHFGSDNWDKGMVEGVRAICGFLDGSMERSEVEEDDTAIIIFLIIVIFAGMVVMAIAVWMSSRCPKCRKHKLKRVSELVVSRANGYITTEQTIRCENCGHIFKRLVKSADPNYRGPRGGGIIIGGGGIGRGGGFSGGSFGGGSFGGGGAGSRF